MTTHNFTKYALLSALIIFSAVLSAQTIIEYDGSSTDGQMTLTETGAVSDFSRLLFRHSSDVTNRWAISALPQTGQTFGTLESPIVFAYSSATRLLLGKDGKLRINNAYTLPNVDGTNGQVLTTDGSGIVSWAAGGGGSSPWSTSGANVYRATGNVGIGTSAPGSKLDVVVTGNNGIRVIGNDAGDARVSILNGTGNSHVLFDDDSDAHTLKLESSNAFAINTGGINERFRIEETGDAEFIGGDVTISGTDPELLIVNDGAGDSRIAFGNNGGPAGDAAIYYDSSEDMLEIGTNTLNGNIAIAGDGKVGVNETTSSNLIAQMTIKANAGNTTTPSTLDLAENNNSGYPVLRYTNFAVAGSFTAEANSQYFSGIGGAADYRIRFSEDGTEANKKDILSAVYAYRDENGGLTDSKDERVGIRTADPLADLHLVHKSGVAGHGLRIQNEDANNHWWKMYVSDGAGTLAFRNSTSPTSNVGTFATNGTYTASDLRLKRNIEDIPYGIKQIMKLNAKRYNYNSDKAGDKMSIGFIAQELDKIVPELVLYDAESDQYSVNYAGMSVVAVKAIQEQQTQIEALQSENIELKNQIATILARLDAEGK